MDNATVVAPVKLAQGPVGLVAHSTRYVSAVATRENDNRPVPSNDLIANSSALLSILLATNSNTT